MCLFVSSQPTRIGKALSAFFADIGSLVRMRTDVDLEMVSSGEGLVAIRPSALIRLGTCVSACVGRQSTGSRKSSATSLPSTLPSLGGGLVGHSMNLQSAGVGEGCSTIGPCAFVLFRTRMQKLVVFEARVRLEGGTAAGTVAVELLSRLLKFSQGPRGLRRRIGIERGVE